MPIAEKVATPDFLAKPGTGFSIPNLFSRLYYSLAGQHGLGALMTAIDVAAFRTGDFAMDDDDVSDKLFTVLYVEDNMWNGKLLPEALAPLRDVEVLVARDGQHGLAVARSVQPDLIILDLHLPDMNGDEVLRRLRLDDNLRNIPVFALTADASQAAEILSEKAGFDEFITKPFRLAELLFLIRTTLDGVARRSVRAHRRRHSPL